MDIEYIEDKKHNPCNWCVYSLTKDSEASMCKRCELWQIREMLRRVAERHLIKGAIRDAIDYGSLYRNNFTIDVVDKAIRIHIMNSMRGKKPDKIIVSEDIFAAITRDVTWCSEDRDVSTFGGIPLEILHNSNGEIIICDDVEYSEELWRTSYA